MSRKTTAALIAALGINFALAGGAIMLANLNKPLEYDLDEAFAASPGDLKDVAGKPVDAAAGHIAVPLKAAQQGGDTRVAFTAAKSTPGGRDVHEGTWDQIAGGILYKPETEELIAIEAAFDTRSLRTDAHGLTNTVTAKEKWFDIDNHPIATFTCDQFTPVDAATSSHTHDLVGSITLNGITKQLTIPAAIAFSGQSLALDASFTILRSDYNVQKRDSSIAGSVGGVVSKVEEEVDLTVRVMASPDPTAVISELAQAIEAQREELRIAGLEREALKKLVRQVELLDEKIGSISTAGIGPKQAIDVSVLVPTFNDVSTGNAGPYPFEMVLVPGDDAKGIAPFYLAKHEVTWGMIDKWMYCGDLEGKLTTDEIADLINNQGLRPTPLFGTPTQIVQLKDKDNPAMAMSLKTAQLYCKWLSEQTGRTYRLPTIDEWQHAMRAGGGRPENLDAYAWHAGNTLVDEIQLNPATAPVGGKEPNLLGIHDMFGSVAEWVTGTGEDRVIVGGSFLTPPEETTEDWKMIEDQEVWNENYPNLPKSIYWYSDVYYTGIRLVCEPASVVANPPKDE